MLLGPSGAHYNSYKDDPEEGAPAVSRTLGASSRPMTSLSLAAGKSTMKGSTSCPFFLTNQSLWTMFDEWDKATGDAKDKALNKLANALYNSFRLHKFSLAGDEEDITALGDGHPVDRTVLIEPEVQAHRGILDDGGLSAGKRSSTKVISFTTPDNTKPAFNAGYPRMSKVSSMMNSGGVSSSVVKVMLVMPDLLTPSASVRKK